MQQDQQELSRRVGDCERLVRDLQRESEQELESLKNLVNVGLTRKADYRDIDNLASQLQGKAENERVQDLVKELRSEILGEIKKQKKGKKKEEKSQELAFQQEKAFEELKTLREKLTKLAG